MTTSDPLLPRFVGTMVGGAIGDALGRPAETYPRDEVARMFPGGLRDFVAGGHYANGPAGAITDDTQFTLAVAHWLADAPGDVVPDGADLARRYVALLPELLGESPATRGALERIAAGADWRETGNDSGGNGVAMRSAPIGLPFHGDLAAMRECVHVSSLPTHRNSTAEAGGIAVAAMVSHLLGVEDGVVDGDDLVGAAVSAMSHLDLDPYDPYAGGGPGVTLAQRLAEVPTRARLSVGEAFAYFFNGSFVLQSLPITVWLFLAFPYDPERLLVEAVMGGRDADTIAAMAGNLAGALHGVDAFPPRWRDPGPERMDEVIAVAERLHERWRTSSP